MKLRYILTALTATTLVANATTTLTQSSYTGNGNYIGQTFAVSDAGFILTGDALTGSFDLDTVTFTKGNSDTAGASAVYLTVYDGIGGTIIGTSTNSFDWTSGGLATGGAAAFDFTGVTAVDGLSDATTFFFGLSNADGTSAISVRLAGGNSPSDPLSTGNLIKADETSENAAYDATVSVGLTAVPEPSSAALLGLGGLAFVLRRRK